MATPDYVNMRLRGRDPFTLAIGSIGSRNREWPVRPVRPVRLILLARVPESC